MIDTVSTVPINEATIFFVSGGARGITAACVIGMAQRFRCQFVLLGRTTLTPVPAWVEPGMDDATLKQRIAGTFTAQGERAVPAAIQRVWRTIRACEEIEATLAAIRVAGGTARYVSADVTDPEGLRAALRQADIDPAGITGLIHGAGALADKRIEQKTGADFDAVYGPKITGLQSLLTVLPPGQLRYLVLFSSGAGFFGNLGQTDYALANEILNKAAYQLQRDHPACRVLSLNWGPWDGGMVTPAIKALFAQRQIAVIPVDGGVAVLVEQLARAETTVQLLVGSPMLPAPAPLEQTLRTYRLHRQLTEAANPFLRDHMIGLHAVLPATAAASWMSDGCAQLYPGYHLRRCDTFQVLKGIIFDEHLAPTYQLELRETFKDEAEGVLRLDAVISSKTSAGKPRFHYRATIELGRKRLAPPSPGAVGPGEDQCLDGAQLYRDGTLFHGPLLQSIQCVVPQRADRLVLRCQLPAVSLAAQGQFRAETFNAYVADALLQAGLVWIRQKHHAASLPLGWARLGHYQPLAFEQPFYLTLTPCASNELRLSADITAFDAAGQVLLAMHGAEFAVSHQLDRLFALRNA
ncbi:SDR family NAD(P)-dependent oxidoreductase [Candidatus Chloroploca sp. Khr17]|uniref:SDR family NAD(P)-dependent oxidoreductase n=1 Tax=Candidatus Chloroploca sp. Khr17 TaxID=2496869 RepID=UPI00101D4E95|nr:SDR family NAD(P)-dependent oxidoreductase [Candidatus Chloroploca sp. Khr17]